MTTSNERKPFAALGGGKPPMKNIQNHGIDSATLNSLTSKTAPSRWSVNIQEIVKRTQKNLERGSSSHNGGSSDQRAQDGDMQYLSKHMKIGFGSSSTKEKSSLLYHDLKRKLQYDTGAAQQTQELSSGMRKKENLINNNLGLHSAKAAARPASINAGGSGQLIASKSLYLANQKSTQSGANQRMGIQRIKRRGQDEIEEYNNSTNANNISVTTGSIQGTQGGEMYQELGNNMGSGIGAAGDRQIEERAASHQRTLHEAGKLNMIVPQDINNNGEPDEESHMLGTHPRYEFRRHNSNFDRPTYSIEDQENGEDTQEAIMEAGAMEEQSYRNVNRSLNYNKAHDEPAIMSTKNFMTEGFPGGGGGLKLKPSNSTGATHMSSGALMMETQNKRQFLDARGNKTMQNGSKSSLEHRQKIFEEEIIKRIKEIQRYVKSLHLQIKKTQANQDKIKDEVECDKDVLLSLQQQQENQNKKFMGDRLKAISQAEMESNIKESENRSSDKMILLMQEAIEQTLKQVTSEIIPDTRLKMYDSISEETKRVKMDTDYQIQAVKREQADQTKKDRFKSEELISLKAESLRNEMLGEKNTQTLQILAQVDAQIVKALKEQEPRELPRNEISNLRDELENQIRLSGSKLCTKLREEQANGHDKVFNETEQKLEELENSINEQLRQRLTSQASLLISPEQLSEKLLSLKQELAKHSQNESKRAMESQKVLFITSEKLQTEVQKVKREVSKQVKTGLEEAKFDTVQMVRSDIVEVSNSQKDTAFKFQEFQGNFIDLRAQVEEAVQRLTNKEKEQTQLQMTAGQMKQSQAELENRVEAFGTEMRELKYRERTPVKEDRPDSHREEAASSSFVIEELNSVRQEIKELSQNWNITQSLVEENKMAVSTNKSSFEKQLKAVKTQIDDLKKQQIDEQFEARQNKQFLEDQLSEIVQSLEGLQARILEAEETHSQEGELLKKELLKLDESSERQFQNLHNEVSLLEEWQVRAQNDIASLETTSKPPQQDNSPEVEAIQSTVRALSMRIESVEEQVTSLESEVASKDEVVTLKGMLATISERNSQLEGSLTDSLERIQHCLDETYSVKEMVESLKTFCDVTKAENVALSKKNMATASEEISEFESKLAELRSQLEDKIDSLPKGASNTMMQVTTLSSQPSQPSTNSKWQESSVKKIQPKKSTGWAEVKMTRIEPNENLMRSSNLEMQMVCAKGPVSASDNDEEVKEEEAQPFESADPQVDETSSSLYTPEKTISKKQSTTTQPQSEEQQNLPNSSPMSFENQVKDDYKSNNNISELRKPTEYSASVEQLPTTQRNGEKEAYLMGELEIQSPVQFEMLPESDVKVNETNSSQANLMIQDRIAYDDDNNLNDQIISPSEGIQVPHGDFYQLQREIRSNQVHKKSKMVIAVVENEVESEKVESPKPLSADDFSESPIVEDKKLHLPKDESTNNLQIEEMRGMLTLEFELEGQHENILTEGTQLFRTQKMSGLAMLSQKATKEQLEALDEADSEMDQKLGDEANQFGELDDESAVEEEEEEEEEESEINDDELPAGNNVLNMKLGEHMRINSDGKSSMMGLSALGLESHRESISEVQMAIPDSIPNSVPSSVQVSARSMLPREESSIGDDASEQEECEEESEEETEEDQAISAFIFGEIEEALRIMQELQHPEVATLQ